MADCTGRVCALKSDLAQNLLRPCPSLYQIFPRYLPGHAPRPRTPRLFAFLIFKRTFRRPSLHIIPPHVLLPPFKNREKHTDATWRPSRAVERALVFDVGRLHQTAERRKTGESTVMCHWRPYGEVTCARDFDVGRSSGGKRMKMGKLGKFASDGGGVTAEFGFQRTRAAREGAVPAGMTASV